MLINHKTMFTERETHWSKDAINCYRLGFDCERCNIPNIMETRCNMKNFVQHLIQTIGRPNKASIPTVQIIEEKGEKIMRIKSEFYDKDLDLTYANCYAPMIDAVKKGYKTYPDIGKIAEQDSRLLSVYFDSFYKHLFKLNLVPQSPGKPKREAVIDFVQNRLFEVNQNSKKPVEEKEKPVITVEFEPPLEYEKLTPQEECVKKLLLQGLTYKDITEKLVLSMSTVKTHVNNIFAKKGYHSLRELLVKEVAQKQIIQNEYRHGLEFDVIETKIKAEIAETKSQLEKVQADLDELNTLLNALVIMKKRYGEV